jgi:septal ring factor EnvC (AmiA/AmiB activator)
VPRVEKLAWDARRRRWIEVTIVLTALAALVGLYATYFFHFEDKLTKHAQATSEAVEKLQQQTAVVQKSSVPATAKLDETQQRVEELRQELADVKAELHSLQDQMRTPAPPHQ